MMEMPQKQKIVAILLEVYRKYVTMKQVGTVCCSREESLHIKKRFTLQLL